jgi:hypothetical protein
MYVTNNFIQGSEATIINQFGEVVEIETTTPENYSQWAITDRDDEFAALALAKSIEDKKTNGLTYTLNEVDYLVPLSSEDAGALMQVQNAFSFGVTETVLYFTNGVKMPITAAEFDTFGAWFVAERNAFFV